MNNTEKFDQQLQGMVNKERAADYGHPSEHFEVSSGLKKLIRDHFDIEGDERLLHAMDMVCDKLARLCHTPTHFDSWLDIAGYARTAMMVMDRYHEQAVRDFEAEKENEKFLNDSGRMKPWPLEDSGIDDPLGR